eukprot:819351-Prymnesium_polylepis.3
MSALPPTSGKPEKESSSRCMRTTGRVSLTTNRKLPICTVASTVTDSQAASGKIRMLFVWSFVDAQALSLLAKVTRSSSLIVRELPSSKATTTSSELELRTLIGGLLASFPEGVRTGVRMFTHADTTHSGSAPTATPMRQKGSVLSGGLSATPLEPHSTIISSTRAAGL